MNKKEKENGQSQTTRSLGQSLMHGLYLSITVVHRGKGDEPKLDTLVHLKCTSLGCCGHNVSLHLCRRTAKLTDSASGEVIIYSSCFLNNKCQGYLPPKILHRTSYLKHTRSHTHLNQLFAVPRNKMDFPALPLHPFLSAR